MFLGRFIILVILVLGAGFYFPMTRPTLVDAAGPIVNPAFVWQTRGEMDKITRRLQMLNREGQALPDQGQDFAEWMVRNFQGGSGRDAWGNEYTLVTWADSVGIISKGPDLEIGTPDDVQRAARIQRQRRRR